MISILLVTNKLICFIVAKTAQWLNGSTEKHAIYLSFLLLCAFVPLRLCAFAPLRLCAL
jgi:hypothetical protein